MVRDDPSAIVEVKCLKSPLEIDLVRLLHRCEQRALNDSTKMASDWRQEKYISCLKDFLKKLQLPSTVSKPSSEDMRVYKDRVTLLEQNLEAVKASLVNDIEQSTSVDSTDHFEELIAFGDTHNEAKDTTESAPQTVPVRSPENEMKNSLDSSTVGHSELQAKTSAFSLNELRKELIPSAEESETFLRHRGGKESSEQEQTVEAILSRHNAMQEKIADDMLKLARSLKQTTLTANEVIKRDQESLNRANEIASTNFDKLKVETGRVANSKPLGCQWWLFVVLGAVVLVFIWVVFLIKIT